jgi:malonate decarboxylase epsilon subunit
MSRVLVEEGVRPVAVAGLSVGAFAAAVESGTICLSDGVHLVRQRAEMMMKLYPKGYGLAAIVGLTER